MKTDIMSLYSLANWLSKKDPNEEYCYGNGYICACAQYFQEMYNDKQLYLYKDEILFCNGAWREYPHIFDRIAHGCSRNRTFGAMYERCLREIVKQETKIEAPLTLEQLVGIYADARRRIQTVVVEDRERVNEEN